MTHSAATLLVATVLTLSLAAGGSHPAAAQLKQPSKVADSVQRTLKDIDATAPTPTLRRAPVDLSVLSSPLVRVSPTGKIELVFHAAGPIGDAEVRDLEALGADIVTRLTSPAGLIQAWVPYQQVEVAAALPWVVAVTPPAYGEHNTHPINPINSEGVALHNADVAQAQGVTGTGVTVGVISDGVSNLAAAQMRNELPAVNVINAGSGDEGTGMLEIVHDMAPGAALAFHGTGGGTAGHVTAVQNLVTAGVNVIAEDLAFDAEPAFQRGVVATARENAAAAGVSVHSSSGNRGANHAARVLAIGTGSGPDGNNGPFTNCPIAPLNVVAIAPGGDTTFDVVLGASTRFTLQWSEPRAIFPTAGAGGFTDLDLYIMDAAGTTCLATSLGTQGGGAGDTIEQIATPAALAGTAAKIVVNVFGATGAVAAPILDVRWRGTQSQTDTPTRAGSNDPDKNYTGLAWSIGAVNVGSGTLEGFSSAGPVDLTLTTVCPGAYPCGAGVAGTGQQFQGLDFLGADGTSVSGVGNFGSGTCPAVNQGDCRFFGTSAAAPHTAGCDALVRQLVGVNAAPDTIRARLASTAVDFAPDGEDSTTGAGQVDCFAALLPPRALCQSRTVPTNPGVCTAATVSIDAGSFDTGGGPVTLAQVPPGPYGLGSTLVTLTATDSDDLSDSCQATVKVVDLEAPVLSNVPGPIQVEQSALAGTPVNVPLPTATDNCNAGLPVSSDAPAVFPLGLTTVTFTATDASGNTATAMTTVTVTDTTPPDIQDVTASPATLWPPSHKMVPVTLTVDVIDICDAALSCQVVSVTSNEPVDAKGDGNTEPDWRIVDDLVVELRAERSGPGAGRRYTVTVRCTDDSGNSAMRTVDVPVAHDQRK
jgi:subtilase family protein/HYR domain-containing protein